MRENAKTCENCRTRCGGFLGAGPNECGSWEAMPTAQEVARENGASPVNFIPAGDVTDSGQRLYGPSFGLTKRELFAAMATQSMFGGSGLTDREIALCCVSMADHLVAALAATEPTT